MMTEYLSNHGFMTYTLDGKRITERYGKALTEQDQTELDALMAAYVEPVPELTPRQFKRFFVLSGLDVFVSQNLPALRSTNPEMYADVVSQLEGGKVFYWPLTEHFMKQLVALLPNAPAVDFDQLRSLWIAQADHHIEI